jgi:hypothetical protein
MRAVNALVKLPVPACLAIAALLGSGPRAVTAADSLSDLTGPWHLFVDDYAVAGKTGVVRTYHPFQKYAGNPVMVADRAWEGANIYVYGTALPNESGPGYRMWYHCLNLGVATYALYATSADGIHWTKPVLGDVSYNGSTDNNILIPSGCFPSVMHTPWDAAIQRTYKMIYYGGGRFYGAWSADAIHWTDSPNNPVIPPVSDVGNYIWDPHTRQYVGYPKVGATVNNLARRAVGYTATADFESWPSASLILAPDAVDDRWVPAGTVQRTHFYGLCGFAYESMYLGFLWIFRATDVDGYYDGPIYVEIVSSHDGIHWTREEGDRPPILPDGPAGSWDYGMVFTTTQPMVEGGTIRLYYGGFNDLHAQAKNWHGAIGLATLRKDGFASLDAGATPGTITTQKIDHASGPLRVNFSAPSSSVKVEVLDESGTVLPGYSQAECNVLAGDSVDQVVTWTGHAELPAGVAPVRLRFILQNASVYSFAAGDAAVVIELPSVTKQPADRLVSAGATATFGIRAKGTRPLSYQWQRDGIDLTDGGHYSGATMATLTVSNVSVDDVGSYRCVVSNPYGSTASNWATLAILTATIAGTGSLPGSTSSTISGISADGSVVCGNSGSRAMIWTAADGARDLGVPADATTASAAGVGIVNGHVVVAVNTDAAGFKARRWDGTTTGAGTYAALPLMAGTLEWLARGVGTDGTTNVWIAGSSFNGGDGGGRQAGLYKQSSNSTTLLGLPANGHDHSDLNAVADNGYGAGQYQYKGTAPTGGARNAMKYTGASSCVALNTYFGAPSTSYEALAKAISRNGLVQGGWSHYSGGGSYAKPIIWNNSATPTTVGFIPGGDGDNWGEVLALNGDGTVAGGYSYHVPGGGEEAFIWDAANGTRQLQGVLSTQYGLDLTGWTLQRMTAMSADALVLAGNGLHNGNAEGWVVRFVQYSPWPPPTITQQPASQSVCPGRTAIFVVAATGDGMISYRWQRNGADLSEGGHYSGVITATLSVSGADANDAGEYRCVVSNAGGSTTSDPAVLTLNAVVAADLDRDCDVDLGDFVMFQTCFNGPNVSPAAGCVTNSDFDGDTDVDLGDFAVFQACFNGPNRPPACD